MLIKQNYVNHAKSHVKFIKKSKNSGFPRYLKMRKNYHFFQFRGIDRPKIKILNRLILNMIQIITKMKAQRYGKVPILISATKSIRMAQRNQGFKKVGPTTRLKLKNIL